MASERDLAELILQYRDDVVEQHLVFFHGLGRGKLDDWFSSEVPPEHWPLWLKADLKNIAIWTVNYEAARTRWSGNAMSFTDRANNVLALLRSRPELQSGEISFVAYSYGGLVSKQLLRSADAKAPQDPLVANILHNTRRICFLGTPHFGAGLATFGRMLGLIFRPSASSLDLVRNAPYLRDLNLWYRAYSANNGIASLNLVESQRTYLGYIVKPDSADPGLPSDPIPVDANHNTIAAPKNRDSEIYIHIRDFLAQASNGRSTKATKPTDHIDTDRQLVRLQTFSRLVSNRTNIVRSERGLPTLTLGDNLYIKRIVEDGIAERLISPDAESSLIVIEGEPGTGKSSLLWALHRTLTEKGIDAWLVDAVELATVFGDGKRGGGILTEEFQTLFQTMIASGRAPLLLIDTADVILNLRGKELHFESLLGELQAASISVVVASRPGEAQRLHILSPYVVQIFEYSDSEFVAAVGAYARAYVRGGESVSAEIHAGALLDAAAQGYPIKEICRNPLTLRMLYSIYAPEQINVADIDVVSLYRAYWERRVVTDVRTDVSDVATDNEDASRGAMLTAIAMLVEGVPELQLAALRQEFAINAVPVSNINILLGRGVLKEMYVESDRSVTFFHQTFFEHAAAISLLRLIGPQGLLALFQRWKQHQGNLFLGAVLERALVLSEFEAYPIREAALEVMNELSNHGAAGLSVLVYAFVHRRAVPDLVLGLIEDRVQAGDVLAIERLLGISGNATRHRRLDLISLLGRVVESKNSRWIRRSMELLLRFSSPDIDTVAKVVMSPQVRDILTARTDSYPQGRTLFLEFLARFFHFDQERSLRELIQQLSDALRRGSDVAAMQVLNVIADACRSYPYLAELIEGGISAKGLSRTSGGLPELFGELFCDSWKIDQQTPSLVIESLDKASYQGLSLTARLNGLATLLSNSSPGEAIEAFRASTQILDPTTRVMLGRITWSRFLPFMLNNWKQENSELVSQSIKILSKGVFENDRSFASELVFHIIQSDPSVELATRLLDEVELSDPRPWLEITSLGRHLVRGVAANIEGAKNAFIRLLEDPIAYGPLSHASLTQIRNSAIEGASLSIGMELALRTSDTESVLDFLTKVPVAPTNWTGLADMIRHQARKLRKDGNVKLRRQAIHIEYEMARLHLDPSIGWNYLSQQATTETDDINLSLVVRSLGLSIECDADQIEKRLSWLATLSLDKGAETRTATIQIFSQLYERRPDLLVRFIDQLFELAFRGHPDGNTLKMLSNPMFALYRMHDPRVAEFAEMLIQRSKLLPMQTCRRISGTFRRLFGMIMQRMSSIERKRLLSQVPALNRYLARMIVEGFAASEAGLADQFQPIIEHPLTSPEIVTLASRFAKRELRTSGLERWPELYKLIK